MKKVIEALQKRAGEDRDTVELVNAKKEDFLMNMSDEQFGMWAKQLGVVRGSKDWQALKELVEEIKRGKI